MRRQEDTPGHSVGRRLLLAALLVGAGLAAYLPVIRAGFVWDDDTFLTANPLIRAHDGLARFWFTGQASDYWPLTSSSLWLEWRLWGMHPAGYHCTNLALHLGGALLLWSVLRRAGLPGAYLAALLFAVHPVNVESVAWIAQRKNLMAMLFYLVSIACFLRTDALEDPTKRWRVPLPGSSKKHAVAPTGSGTRQRFVLHRPGLWYGLSLLAFVLALLSKGSVAPLPIVLLGLIAWNRPLSLRDVVWIAPFFLVAAALAFVNVWFQGHGTSGIIRDAGFLERALGAGAILWFYLLKAFWPVNLIFVYPHWNIRAENPLWWIPLAAAVGLTAVLWRHRRSATARGALFAWAYFGAMLTPVMGFADVYFMKYSLVADHYQHLALIGVVAFAAAGWARWERRRPGWPPRAAAAATVALLAALTLLQSRNYRDAETLYASILAQNPGSWLAQNNLGVLLRDRGREEEAMSRFREALRLKPDYAEAHIDLGNGLLRLGRPAEAAREFETALADRSDFDREAHLDLGHAWFRLGKTDEAADQYRAALRIDPGYSEAHYSLGNVLFSLERFPAAVAEYRLALRTAPDDADALNNLGSALVRAGRPAEAVAEYQKALLLRPADGSISANLEKARAAAEIPSGQR